MVGFTTDLGVSMEEDLDVGRVVGTPRSLVLIGRPSTSYAPIPILMSNPLAQPHKNHNSALDA